MAPNAGVDTGAGAGAGAGTIIGAGAGAGAGTIIGAGAIDFDPDILLLPDIIVLFVAAASDTDTDAVSDTDTDAVSDDPLYLNRIGRPFVRCTAGPNKLLIDGLAAALALSARGLISAAAGLISAAGLTSRGIVLLAAALTSRGIVVAV